MRRTKHYNKRTTNYHILCIWRLVLNPYLSAFYSSHVLGQLTYHTIDNMLLLLIGPMLEEKYGSQRLLVVILVVALA